MGSILGAIGTNDFLRAAKEYGQTGGDHARPQTDLDDAERLASIYGSEGSSPSERAQVTGPYPLEGGLRTCTAGDLATARTVIVGAHPAPTALSSVGS